MRIVTAVVFEGSEDSHIANRFQYLEGWADIDLRDETDPERRAFRRIRGNAASLDDLGLALGAALRAAGEKEVEADTLACPFPEIPGRASSVEEDWRNGLRQVPGLIRREVEGLLEVIEQEIGVRLEIRDVEDAALASPEI